MGAYEEVRIAPLSVRETIWLGWRDSNPRMAAPKAAALPLGDTPDAHK